MKYLDTITFVLRHHIERIVFPTLTIAGLVLAMQACTNEPEQPGSSTNQPSNEPPIESECVDGAEEDCFCNNIGYGWRTCYDGAFGACICPTGCKPNAPCGEPVDCHIKAGGPLTCGDGIVDPDEECDDNDCDPTDECNNNCQWPYCGDNIIQFPETCDGDETCPPDCGYPELPPGCTGCKGQVFKDFIAMHDGEYSGLGQFGIDAVNAECQALGGARMCNYKDWQEIENYPIAHQFELQTLRAKIPIGTCSSVWLNRTNDLVDCPAGAGGRCLSWNTPNDTLYDGEYVDICNNEGTIQFAYKLDCDPAIDSMDPTGHNAPGLECSAVRIYPCCSNACGF